MGTAVALPLPQVAPLKPGSQSSEYDLHKLAAFAGIGLILLGVALAVFHPLPEIQGKLVDLGMALVGGSPAVYGLWRTILKYAHASKGYQAQAQMLAALLPGVAGKDAQLVLQLAGKVADALPADPPADAPAADAPAAAGHARLGVLLAMVAGCLLFAGTARAGGFLSGLDWSIGPTFPMVVYDLDGHFNLGAPTEAIAGGGVQVSVTHDSLKKAFMGHSWDMLDLVLMGFGTKVKPAGQPTFGQLSAAVGPCTFSSMVCVVGGLHLLSSAGQPNMGAFVGVNFSFSFALAPAYPPRGEEGGAAVLPRGGTLYFGAP